MTTGWNHGKKNEALSDCASWVMLRPKIINSGTRHGEFEHVPSNTQEKSHPQTSPLTGDEKRISHNPWRDLKDLQIWHLGTQISGGLGSAALMVGFTDHRGLCQSILFHDSKMKGFYFCCVAGLDQMEGSGQGPIPTLSMDLSLRYRDEVHGTVPSPASPQWKAVGLQW